MQISLTDDEIGTLVAAMCMDPIPEHIKKKCTPLVWRLATEKRLYDEMMAAATPLGLVMRLRGVPKPHINPSSQLEGSDVDGGESDSPRANHPSPA